MWMCLFSLSPFDVIITCMHIPFKLRGEDNFHANGCLRNGLVSHKEHVFSRLSPMPPSQRRLSLQSPTPPHPPPHSHSPPPPLQSPPFLTFGIFLFIGDDDDDFAAAAATSAAVAQSLPPPATSPRTHRQEVVRLISVMDDRPW